MVEFKLLLQGVCMSQWEGPGCREGHWCSLSALHIILYLWHLFFPIPPIILLPEDICFFQKSCIRLQKLPSDCFSVGLKSLKSKRPVDHPVRKQALKAAPVSHRGKKRGRGARGRQRRKKNCSKFNKGCCFQYSEYFPQAFQNLKDAF